MKVQYLCWYFAIRLMLFWTFFLLCHRWFLWLRDVRHRYLRECRCQTCKIWLSAVLNLKEELQQTITVHIKVKLHFDVLYINPTSIESPFRLCFLQRWGIFDLRLSLNLQLELCVLLNWAHFYLWAHQNLSKYQYFHPICLWLILWLFDQ